MENPYAPPAVALEDTPAPAPGADAELASRWLRLGGALLDSLLLVVLIVPLMLFTGVLDDPGLVSQLIVGPLLGITAFMLLNGYFIYTRAQTLGKMACGTVVVDREHRRPITGNRYVFVRLLPMWVLTVMPGLGNLLALIDSVLIFRGEKNCLHDDIAGTRVIRKP